MEKIFLKKIKIKNQFHIECEYKFELESGEFSEVKAIYRHQCHEDLLNAMNELKTHLIATCEQDESATYEVNQCSWGGHDDFIGVVICGNRELTGNRKLNLVSPFVMFNDDTSTYERWRDLEHAVNKLEEESILYIKGKSAPKEQMELEFEPSIKEA